MQFVYCWTTAFCSPYYMVCQTYVTHVDIVFTIVYCLPGKRGGIGTLLPEGILSFVEYAPRLLIV